MKEVDLNKARFGDIFLDHDGKKLIYNKKCRGYHELLEERSNRLLPYTDDGWFRWHFNGLIGETVLTRKIPVEERNPLTTRIVHADDHLGLMQIHMIYERAFKEEVKRLQEGVDKRKEELL